MLPLGLVVVAGDTKPVSYIEIVYIQPLNILEGKWQWYVRQILVYRCEVYTHPPFVAHTTIAKCYVQGALSIPSGPHDSVETCPWIGIVLIVVVLTIIVVVLDPWMKLRIVRIGNFPLRPLGRRWWRLHRL